MKCKHCVKDFNQVSVLSFLSCMKWHLTANSNRATPAYYPPGDAPVMDCPSRPSGSASRPNQCSETQTDQLFHANGHGQEIEEGFSFPPPNLPRVLEALSFLIHRFGGFTTSASSCVEAPLWGLNRTGPATGAHRP